MSLCEGDFAVRKAALWSNEEPHFRDVFQSARCGNSSLNTYSQRRRILALPGDQSECARWHGGQRVHQWLRRVELRQTRAAALLNRFGDDLAPAASLALARLLYGCHRPFRQQRNESGDAELGAFLEDDLILGGLEH